MTSIQEQEKKRKSAKAMVGKLPASKKTINIITEEKLKESKIKELQKAVVKIGEVKVKGATKQQLIYCLWHYVQQAYAKDSNLLNNLFKLDQVKKLAILQVTPKMWIKTRAIGEGKTYRYIKVQRINRIFNFLFNFAWSTEIQEVQYSEYKRKTKEWEENNGKKTFTYVEKPVQEANVILKFTCTLRKEKIVRTVSGAFVMYENPATPKKAVIQAAISQAKRNVALEFGIGADLNDEDITEEARYNGEPLETGNSNYMGKFSGANTLKPNLNNHDGDSGDITE